MSNNTGLRSIGDKLPQQFSFNITTGVVTKLIPSGDADQRILLLGLVLSSSGAGTVIFRSNTDEMSRLTFLAADPPLVLPSSPDGWMWTAKGESLRLDNITDSLTLTGFGTYFYL